MYNGNNITNTNANSSAVSSTSGGEYHILLRILLFAEEDVILPPDVLDTALGSIRPTAVLKKF